MAKGDMTCHNNLIMQDGTIVPFENLTFEQIQEWEEHAGESMAKAFQEYYSHHPEEF